MKVKSVCRIKSVEAWAIKELADKMEDIWNWSKDSDMKINLERSKRELQLIMHQVKLNDGVHPLFQEPIFCLVDRSMISQSEADDMACKCLENDDILIDASPRKSKVFWSIDGFVRRLMGMNELERV